MMSTCGTERFLHVRIFLEARHATVVILWVPQVLRTHIGTDENLGQNVSYLTRANHPSNELK
jgi:hypothetical protein